ncbi:MAG: hypothetical protein LBS10_11095 [Gracilibacteraceae bacterium]|jgi:hypothetical protein|nr:hypothetical protein [Gracilibacteraceae bacterium]
MTTARKAGNHAGQTDEQPAKDAKSAKVYVPVLAAFNADGVLLPVRLRWEDGTVYRIEKVLDIRPAAAQKAGGQGDRYTIQVGGRQSYIFFERSASVKGNSLGRWFVERR